MTSTLLQQQLHATVTVTAKKTTAATQTATRTAATTMAWSNDKLRFSCIDNIGLKQLWKLIALDSSNTTTTTTTAAATTNNITKAKRNNKHDIVMDNNTTTQQQQQQQCEQQQEQQIINNNNNEKLNYENCENLADYLTNRDILPPSRMSLLKFLAINALELSAPATPVLLQQQQQQQQQQTHKPQGWMQLSGHPESIVPTSSGIVRKRIASITDSEVHAYDWISHESQTAQIVPNYYGTRELNGEYFIELQDLLAGFKDPCVMDIKMGSRTFLESEVSNKTSRPDLYKKMIAVDACAPTAEEHAAQAITKLRYMLFREALSSSHSKGFRIEALRLRGRQPVKDLKTCRTSEQITQTIEQFLATRKSVQKELIKRLKHMRLVIEQSEFFQRHEIVGSSIFIVYDDAQVGVWLIDFAKSRQLPNDMYVNHRADWLPGNREEGLLKGLDELIHAFETVQARNGSNRKCLQI